MASTLLGSIDHRLPNELTLAVVQQLASDYPTLCSLAQTCRGFQQLAEEHMYRTIKLRSVKDLQHIISAFIARPERVRAVHTLKILYRHNENLQVSLERRKKFNECVAQMVNLREWHIESPYDNFKWEKGGHEWVEGDMERFRQALEKACVDGAQEKRRFALDRTLHRSLQRTVGLAQLESLTIHSHGAHADFWDLDGFHCLFRHPSLRYLHVSCVTFPRSLEVLESHEKSTPLTTLIFDECYLETTSLRQILSTPEKLKHLTLGENAFNIHHSHEISPKLSPNPEDALEALAPVAHSLETLIHLDSKWRLNPSNPHIARRRIAGPGMRQFHSLDTLECDTSSFLHEAIIMNPAFCPPNLSTLLIRRHFEIAENFFDFLPDMGIYTSLPSLSTLDLKQSAVSFNDMATAEYICDPDRLRARHAYGFALAQHDINFRVSIELGRGSSLIPPYLYGEPAPETRCVYDAAEVGFRHADDDDAGVESQFEPRHVLTPFHPFGPAPHLQQRTARLDLSESPNLPSSSILRLTNECARRLARLRARFKRHHHIIAHIPSSFSDDSEVDDFSDTDLDGEESDLDAMLADLHNDGDEAAFMQFIAHMQQQGIEIEMGSDDDEEGEEEEEEEEWEDAEEDFDWEEEADSSEVYEDLD